MVKSYAFSTFAKRPEQLESIGAPSDVQLQDAAAALLKNVPDWHIDIFEKYPAPYGLIRYGVAPDHYKTRNTSRQFARTFDEAAVGYYGNVEIGKDISLDELKEHYDAVVLAMGAYNDRKLGIEGENLDGVYGA